MFRLLKLLVFVRRWGRLVARHQGLSDNRVPVTTWGNGIRKSILVFCSVFLYEKLVRTSFVFLLSAALNNGTNDRLEVIKNQHPIPRLCIFQSVKRFWRYHGIRNVYFSLRNCHFVTSRYHSKMCSIQDVVIRAGLDVRAKVKSIQSMVNLDWNIREKGGGNQIRIFS